MVEPVLIALTTAIGGCLITLGHQWRMQHQIDPLSTPFEDDLQETPISISAGGQYQFGSLQYLNTKQPFIRLLTYQQGLTLWDAAAEKTRFIPYTQIQWVSHIQSHHGQHDSVMLHVESQNRWIVLRLWLEHADMMRLTQILRKKLPLEARNFDGKPQQPIGPIAANIAGQTLQGETRIGDAVSLYLLPHMIVILKQNQVLGKLYLQRIKRVLAVERLMNRLDTFWNKQKASGFIRLHSMYETVAFLLPQYRELAEEISFLSQCSMEIVTRADKQHKR